MNDPMAIGAHASAPGLPPTPDRAWPGPAEGKAVSWGAIVAGAVGAAALSMILLILGTGLGFSAVSPWSHEGLSAMTVGVTTVLWLTFTQIAASGMGGYLAGRLRSRWAGTHGDEVYFRDTAHGFLSWALATLVTAGLLSSAIGGVIGTGTQAAASVAGGAAAVVGAAAPMAGSALRGGSGSGGADYVIDALFRSDPGAAAQGAASDDPVRASAEVGRIFANALRHDTLTDDDARYVGQMIAQRTGVPQADAEKRVKDGFTRVQNEIKGAETAAREAADTARKATAYASLWLFISLLVAAFSASLAATYGGRQRDLVQIDGRA